MIPVNRPIVTNLDAKSVYKVVKDGWISSNGPQVKIFENKFKKKYKNPQKIKKNNVIAKSN